MPPTNEAIDFSKKNRVRLEPFHQPPIEFKHNGKQKFSVKSAHGGFFLQQTCQNLMKQIERINNEKEYFFRQYHVYHYLYNQERHDRNRLSKLLASCRKELKYHKRNNCELEEKCRVKKSKTSKNNNKNCHFNTKKKINVELRSKMNDFNQISKFLKENKTNGNIGDCINENQIVNPIDEINFCIENQIESPSALDSRKDSNSHHSNNVCDNWKNNLNYFKSMSDCIEFSKLLLNVDENIHIVKPKSHFDDDDSKLSVQNSNISPKSKEKSGIESEIKLLRLSNHSKSGFLGMFFDMTSTNGVVVRHVLHNSEAQSAKIKPGDRILEICGINMRSANYRLAEKILRECNDEEIVIKIINKTSDDKNNDGDNLKVESNKNLNNQAIETLHSDQRINSVKSTRCSLVRRNAFLNKTRKHIYFYRKKQEKLTLAQTYHLNLNLPRRLFVKFRNPNESFENLKLCGGNAVGIFVHQTNESIPHLRTGDQLLKYNGLDLIDVTAEDAAIHLAEKTTEAEIVALFNIDAYNQIQENTVSDSFYIRAEFSQSSNSGCLKFNKGDILYVDNTLHSGRPCETWRAWLIDEYGGKIQCGTIPSKYNPECEWHRKTGYNRSKNSKNNNNSGIFRNILKRLSPLSFRNKTDYVELRYKSKTRLLATFSMLETDTDDNKSISNISIQSFSSSSSYKLVRKIEYNKPRPLILYGPYCEFLAEELDEKLSKFFKICPKRAKIMRNELYNNSNDTERLESCCEDSKEFISISDLEKISGKSQHAIICNWKNDLDCFYKNEFYPVIFEIKFRSEKHLKECIKEHWRKNKIHSKKISLKTFEEIPEQLQRLNPKILMADSDLSKMCKEIQLSMINEQNKTEWR